MIIQKLRNKVAGVNLGLKPLPEDKRDLGFNWLFGGEYEPKHKRKVIDTLSVKTQLFNTCGWASSVTAKEVDEKKLLSVRGFVLIGKFLGYISGDGFSDLRDNEKAMQKIGVPELGYMSETAKNWAEYSNLSLLTNGVKASAARHKSKSFWRIYKTSEIFKAIDEGRMVKIGVDWYKCLNMSGGFKFPWIYKAISWVVGGHAMIVKGYDTDYQGKRVFIVQNTFGPNYGDKGDLYITPEDLQKEISKYGCYANLDEDVDIGKWLVGHQGAVVKKKDDPKVYLIQGNTKRHYPDLATLFVNGRTITDIKEVDGEYLDAVKEGDVIKFEHGGNIKEYRNAIKYNAELKEIFKNYL